MIYAVNLLIMLGWATATGDWSSPNLATGFAVGFAALWATSGLYGANRYHARAVGAVRLFGFFLWDLASSSVAVACAALSWRIPDAGGFIEMPLDAQSDAEIAVTAHLISLTPGTLSVEVSADRKTLLVHAMFADDPEATAAGLKQGMERRVLGAFR